MKEHINREYDTYLRNLRADEKIEEKIQFINQRAKALFAKESPDVKERVKEMCKVNDDDGDDDAIKHRRRVQRRQR